GQRGRPHKEGVGGGGGGGGGAGGGGGGGEPRAAGGPPPGPKPPPPPQACGTPRPRLRGDARRDVQDGARRDRLVRLAPDAQPPQGRYGHGQPQAGSPIGLGHAGTLPLPAGAFGALEALRNPGPHSIPTGGTGLRRQGGQSP